MLISGSLHAIGGGNHITIDTTPLRFDYTGAVQEYIVPKGVKKLAVDCVGAKGTSNITLGGKGGRVQTVLKVKPGQLLYIYVGGMMPDFKTASYNASDIRTVFNDLTSRVIVAGGGGNGSSGQNGNSPGADGGGLIGASAYSGGTGGNQEQPGIGAVNGTFGLGGNGAYDGFCQGGAGGAGYYGGGSGSASHKNSGFKRLTYAYGGGGGSSYTDSELCSEVIHTQGFNAVGNGYVILTPLEK